MPSYKNDLYSKREPADLCDGGQPRGGTGLLVGTLIVGLGSGLGISALVTPPDPPVPEVERTEAPITFTPGEINFHPPQNLGTAASDGMPRYVRPDGSELQIDGPPKEPPAAREGENTAAPPSGEGTPAPPGGGSVPAPPGGEGAPAE